MSDKDWEALFKRGKRQAPNRDKRYERWVEANPLRQWRNKHGYSYRKTHELMKDKFGPEKTPAFTSIYYWEHGLVPSEENFKRIAALLEEMPKALAKKWRSWLESRPQ